MFFNVGNIYWILSMRVFLVFVLRNRFLIKFCFMWCSGEGIYIFEVNFFFFGWYILDL